MWQYHTVRLLTGRVLYESEGAHARLTQVMLTNEACGTQAERSIVAACHSTEREADRIVLAVSTSDLSASG
jgi:hypothetical protein